MNSYTITKSHFFLIFLIVFILVSVSIRLKRKIKKQNMAIILRISLNGSYKMSRSRIANDPPHPLPKTIHRPSKLKHKWEKISIMIHGFSSVHKFFFRYILTNIYDFWFSTYFCLFLQFDFGFFYWTSQKEKSEKRGLQLHDKMLVYLVFKNILKKFLAYVKKTYFWLLRI